MPRAKDERDFSPDPYEPDADEPRRWLILVPLLLLLLGAILLLLFLWSPIFQSKEARFRKFRRNAAALVADGHHTRALAAYERALALRPNHLSLRTEFARCRLQAGDLPEAIAEYRRCLREKPDDSQILLRLASLYLLAKNVERSEEVLGAVLDSKPDDILALVLWAQCHYERGDTLHPLVTVSMITDILPPTSSRYDLLTPSTVAASDPDHEQRLLQAVTSQPDEVQPHKNLADFYVQRNRLAEAEAAYLKMVAAAPRDPDVYLHLADFYRSKPLGRLDDALQQYSRVLSTVDPKNLFALRGISGLSMATADLTQARRYVDKLLWEHPSDPFGRYFRGVWEILNGQFVRAEEDFLFVTKQESEYAPAHFLLGYTRLLNRDMEGARNSLDEAARRKPDFARPRLLMAEISVNLGQEDEALNIINDFFTDDRQKDNPLACILRGRILISRNEMTQAESPFTQLGELDKDTVYPRLLLGEIYKRVGNNEQSEAHYQAAIDADPESPLPPYLLGLLHQRIGKPVLARANYEKAVERSPNLRIAVRSLAELYVGSLREHAVPSASGETLVKTLMETLNTRFPDNLTLHVTLLDAVGRVFSERTQFDRAVEIFELIPEHERDARPHIIYHYATALYGGAGEARVEAQRLSGKAARQASQKAAEWTARSRRELQKAARWLRDLPTAEQVDQKLNEVLGGESLLR